MCGQGAPCHSIISSLSVINDRPVSKIETCELLIMQLLKKLCNPKRFTKPYNAEKVDKANALYAKLKKESISCSEYVQIKKDIDELYDGTNVSPQAL